MISWSLKEVGRSAPGDRVQKPYYRRWTCRSGRVTVGIVSEHLNAAGELVGMSARMDSFMLLRRQWRKSTCELPTLEVVQRLLLTEWQNWLDRAELMEKAVDGNPNTAAASPSTPATSGETRH